MRFIQNIKDKSKKPLPSTKKFNKILEFTKSLELNNKGKWIDEYGSTDINLGENLVSNLIQKLNKKSANYIIILSPLLKDKISIFQNHRSFKNKNIDYIISIGGAKEHNQAKEFILKNYSGIKTRNHNLAVNIPHLITIPFPLSNDSFGTNRSSPFYDKVEVPSRESIYPSKIIIDFKLLNNIKNKLNIQGIGEFIGLYYSLYDYYSIKGLLPSKKLITNLERSAYNLITTLTSDKNLWLKLLAINLIQKCLIMRVNKDNQIGAGGDHLIAYALQQQCINSKKYGFDNPSHGKLVYLGSIVMASLFPEWEYGFFSLKNLVDTGLKIKIIQQKDLNLLVKMLKHNLIQLALKTRPLRKTSLSLVSQDKIKNGLIRINSLTNRAVV